MKDSRSNGADERAMRALKRRIIDRSYNRSDIIFCFLGFAEKHGVTYVVDQLCKFLFEDTVTERIALIWITGRMVERNDSYPIIRAPELEALRCKDSALPEFVEGVESNGVHLFPTGSPNSPGFGKQLTEVVLRMRRLYDIILIDGPSLTEPDWAVLCARIADCVYLVLASGEMHGKVAESHAEYLKWSGKPIDGVILNKYSHVIPQFVY